MRKAQTNMVAAAAMPHVRAAFMGAGTGWNRFNVAFQTPAGNYNSAVMRKTG
jgi:hypothetical protein